jgi:GT2 family glycosyltransferase
MSENKKQEKSQQPHTSFYLVDIGITKIKSHFHPISIQDSNLIDRNKAKADKRTPSTIFCEPGYNQVLVRITHGTCTNSISTILDQLKEDGLNPSAQKLSNAAAYLWLTRWLFTRCERVDTSITLEDFRTKHWDSDGEILNEVYDIYFDHACSPDSYYIAKGISRYPVPNPSSPQEESIAKLAKHLKQTGILSTQDIAEIQIIIPTYGKQEYTLNCIASILKDLFLNRNFFAKKNSVRIVVTDDAPQIQKEASSKAIITLAQSDFIVFRKNLRNLGFLSNCNAAIRDYGKDSQYVVLLNNDVVVLPGWLQSLIETFDDEPNAGIVGSKLLYPNGTLQEAGGIVWSDASAWNFGRGSKQPFSAPFSYAREVDYISGASIAIRLRAWKDCNGFDESYAPAYYEDTDLAFNARARGYRVIYQPKSQVIHYEGISHGTDTETGIKSYQKVNKKKFFAKWEHSLKLNHYPNGENIWAALHRNNLGSVLVVEDLLLTPTADAGSLFMMNNCLALQALGYIVSYIPANNFCFMSDKARMMGSRGIEIIAFPEISNINQLNNIKGYTPVEYVKEFDLVILARPSNGLKHEMIRTAFPKAKIAYYTHDLHFRRLQREALSLKNGIPREDLLKESERMKSIESMIFKKVDLVLHVSKDEEFFAQDLINHRSCTISPIVALANGAKRSRNKDCNELVFIGGFNHKPNSDGLGWFLDKIYPKLHLSHADAKFHIVGKGLPRDIMSKLPDGSIYHGYVETLEDILPAGGIGIAPLRYGAGVKGKILTYMAHGMPVITTAIGAEGIIDEQSKCESVIIANTADEFAKACNSLISLSAAEYEALSKSALEFYAEYYGGEKVISDWKKALDMLNLRSNSQCTAFCPYGHKSSDITYDALNSFTHYSNPLA